MSSNTQYGKNGISETDRMGVTIIFAVVAHALIILGLTFDYQKRDSEAHTFTNLDVTLVNTVSDETPDKADYLAQSNQKGSGNTTEKGRAQSPPEAAPDILPSPGNAAQIRAPVEASQALHQQSREALTMNNAETRIFAGEDEKKEEQKVPVAAELIKRSLEMAQLEAELAELSSVYAQQPRSKLLIPNTMSHPEAAYLDAWLKKVELIGNMNYPEKAKRSNLSGNLLLIVAINRDGSLNNIELMRSSGYKILDDAAIRIVKLAAPYAPLPKSVLEQADILKIPRTWQFMSGNTLSTR
ncbi:MAG: energy transducer TonB [Gammaproteobacteria bacterium]|nr:energy transducer TonB [Gammaproteobacteria bacterium]